MVSSGKKYDLEILAPAGSRASLEAALLACTDAVYFGLKKFNARRGAENFAPEELDNVVKTVHSHAAKAYLALNIDVSQREIGEAVRHLEFARKCGVDAVLVKDPGLIGLSKDFPELEFHLSTQAAVSSSAGMKAAAELGMKRAVLPRELTLDEIRAASSVSGIETEVFVQGALCFCVSGRCLLSSWAGGRSGNRGLCASPCRVAWKLKGHSDDRRPMSMYDLCLLDKIQELHAAGVKAIKIEGRLKTPSWVSLAVETYLKALKGEDPKVLMAAAGALGLYTGRKMTSGFLDGNRKDLTGSSGRAPAKSAEDRSRPMVHVENEPQNQKRIIEVSTEDDPKGGACWTFAHGPNRQDLRIPLKDSHKIERTVSLADVSARIESLAEGGDFRVSSKIHNPELRISRHSGNSLLDEFLRFSRKAGKAPDDTVRAVLPEKISNMLKFSGRCTENTRELGSLPDRIRIGCCDAIRLGKTFADIGGFIVEYPEVASLEKLLSEFDPSKVLPALPQTFYEGDIESLSELLQFCKDRSLAVEINSWDGWWLAKKAGVQMEAGPGIPVLNALATEKLHEAGCRCSTISTEADREQIETLTSASARPLSLTVFGRPPLMQTRVVLADEFHQKDAVLKDSKDYSLKCFKNNGVTILRPPEPFNICWMRNPGIAVKHLVADFCGSPSPVADWDMIKSQKQEGCRFNYDRKLK